MDSSCCFFVDICEEKNGVDCGFCCWIYAHVAWKYRWSEERVHIAYSHASSLVIFYIKNATSGVRWSKISEDFICVLDVYSLVSHVVCQSLAYSVKKEEREGHCETRYDCDFPLFFLLPVVTCPSCWEILIWPCVCSSSLSSSPSCPFPHIPISPTSLFLCQHNTDGLGSGEDVNLRERCLLWVFHCQEESLVFLFTSNCRSVIADWNLFFELVPSSFGSPYWFLSVLNTECTLADSLLRTLCRHLSGIFHVACCSIDLIWISACKCRTVYHTTALISSCRSLIVC